MAQNHALTALQARFPDWSIRAVSRGFRAHKRPARYAGLIAIYSPSLAALEDRLEGHERVPAGALAQERGQ
jgi:hypothetical protein